MKCTSWRYGLLLSTSMMMSTLVLLSSAEWVDLDLNNDPDTWRNATQIIISRGFQAEEHDVVTKDGYILTIQRVVNPLIEPEHRAYLKPVILQHGLMASSVDWLINSVDVRPAPYPRRRVPALTKLADTQEAPNSLAFYLANEGYDVWLTNSRGNTYGQRHLNMSSWTPAFWSFTFDEHIKYDLPDSIEYVQKLTKHQKLAYVGHSQGSTMILGLLSERPEYADFIEPVVALAPVAFVSNCLTPARYFSYYTPIAQNINMWFGSSKLAVKYLEPIVCGPQVLRRDLCENLYFLAVGFDESQLDESRISAYLAHSPSESSVKNLAHWGQMIRSGRFAKFDHGILANQIKYGQTKAPDYQLSRIRSKGLVLFHANNDWLASAKDVARLESSLSLTPYRSFNISEQNSNWNHIDYIYGKSCGRLINTKIVEVLHQFGGSKVTRLPVS